MIAFYKKLLIMALVLVSLVAFFSNVFATETRVGSMGGIGFYTHDNSNIFFFPGSIYRYSGQVVGEFRINGVKNSYTVGVNYPAKDKLVIGGYLNRPLVVGIPPGVVDQVNLDHTTDLFLGMPLANYDFGLRLSVDLDSHKADTTIVTQIEHKQSAYFISLGAGLSNENTDLAVNFELPHAKNELDTLVNTWSGFGFGVNARMFHGDKTKLVPLGVFSYRKTNEKFEPGTAKTDFTDMNLGLGLGLNHNINEDNLLIMAVELFGYSSSKAKVNNGNETTNSMTTLPGLYMGIESKIKTWLTGRIGVAQVFQSTTLKVKPPSPGTETKTTNRSAPYNVTFGLGLHFGDFQIDGGINEGIFFNGPNFISGNVTNPMATRLSATYQF